MNKVKNEVKSKRKAHRESLGNFEERGKEEKREKGQKMELERETRTRFDDLACGTDSIG